MLVCFKKGCNNNNEDTSEQEHRDGALVQPHDGALVQPHDSVVYPHNGAMQVHDGNIVINSYLWIANTNIYFQIVYL